MINNDKRTVQIRTVTDETDEYGQMILGTPKDIEMSLYRYEQSSTGDIRFTDVELIGVTQSDVKGGDIITDEGEDYMCKYVQKSRIRTVCFLTKQGV